MFRFDAYTPLAYFFLALSLAAFVVEAWAFIDAIMRPSQAFVAAGSSSRCHGVSGPNANPGEAIRAE